MSTLDDRMEICRKVGFRELTEVHDFIVEGARKNSGWLLRKGLSKPRLRILGYDIEGLRRMGYRDPVLREIGFPLPAEPAVKKTPEKVNIDDENDPLSLIKKGCKASDLRSHGITLRQCRVRGLDARELFRLGYDLTELRSEFSLMDLKAVGFNPRELSRFFSGPQLREAGFAAREMRFAGFSVRDLIGFGYNENQIIGAGFSVNELIREGLGRNTSDRDRLKNL